MERTLATFEKTDFFVLIPKLETEINISSHCIAVNFFCNHIKEQCSQQYSKFEANLLYSIECVLYVFESNKKTIIICMS